MIDKLDLRAEARREAERQKVNLEARLCCGDWLDLEEAATLFDIRPGQRCYAVAGYRVRGKRGVLGVLQDLPTDAPIFMTLRMCDTDFVADTVDGETVYGVMIALPDGQSIGATGEILPVPETPAAAEQEAAACVNATEVDGGRAIDLERFFSDMVTAERTWCLSEYDAHLATVGLTFTPDGKRVNVALVKGAVQRRAESKTALLTIMLAFFYGQPVAPVGGGRVTNRSRARSALNWVKAHHPDLVKGDNRYSEMKVTFLEDTHRKIVLTGFLNPLQRS